MKINKLLTITTLVASFSSSAAMAKTEGNYVDLSIINTKAQYSGLTQQETDDNTSFGLGYKYAFNFGKIFVAPSIFYDHNAVSSRSTNSTNDSYVANLRYSYGAKVDIGYDVTDQFALYSIFGHAQNRISNSIYGSNFVLTETNATNSKVDQTLESFIYGLGFRYDVSDNVGVFASYEISQYSKSDDVFDTTDEFNSSYKVARIGVSLNF